MDAAKPPTFELAKDPTPVNGTVKDLKGGGTITLLQGLPRTTTGELSFTLAMDALTQPVESKHAVQWTFTASE